MSCAAPESWHRPVAVSWAVIVQGLWQKVHGGHLTGLPQISGLAHFRMDKKAWQEPPCRDSFARVTGLTEPPCVAVSGETVNLAVLNQVSGCRRSFHGEGRAQSIPDKLPVFRDSKHRRRATHAVKIGDGDRHSGSEGVCRRAAAYNMQGPVLEEVTFNIATVLPTRADHPQRLENRRYL